MPKRPYTVAYITINVLVASDPRPEGSKLLAAVGKFVTADLKVVLATGNESQFNTRLKSSKISGGIFFLDPSILFPIFEYGILLEYRERLQRCHHKANERPTKIN